MQRAAAGVSVDVNDLGTSPRFGSDRSIDQLPAYPCAKLKLDQFFLQWLSEHQDVVNGLVDDVQSGRTIRGPTQQVGLSPLSPSTTHAIFHATTPPMSPSKNRSPGTPLSPHRRSLTTSLSRVPVTSIPRFYFPAVSPPDAQRAEFLQRVDAHYVAYPNGLGQREAVALLQSETCHLPGMIAYALFRRLADPETNILRKEALTNWWLSKGLVTAPAARKVFEALRQEGQQSLSPADWTPVTDAVLAYHPGLEFLQDSSEFQKKYAETVVIRIFYAANRSGSGKMSYRELRRSDVVDALYMLDAEDDINKVLKYFSYEHFYVIYCKFWELDTDHDFQIDRNDLAHYSQCALSFQIIERIFDQAPRRFANRSAKMGYEDFVWFILSEEDKSTETAVEYWFRCVDLDGDGAIRPREMWHFYEEQLKRLEGLSQEPVLFEDVVCQVHDMLQPAVEGAYSLKDLQRKRPQSGLLFNALFNLHKFLAWENRDPFAMRAEAGEFGGLSDWDKFAKIEYYRLASEDEPAEEVTMDADEAVWPEVDSAMLDALTDR